MLRAQSAQPHSFPAVGHAGGSVAHLMAGVLRAGQTSLNALSRPLMLDGLATFAGSPTTAYGRRDSCARTRSTRLLTLGTVRRTNDAAALCTIKAAPPVDRTPDASSERGLCSDEAEGSCGARSIPTASVHTREYPASPGARHGKGDEPQRPLHVRDPDRQSQQRLTSGDLQTYLAEHGLRAAVVPEVSPDDLPAATEAIVKSIVLMVDGSPLLAVVRGDGRVDERKVADLVKVARRRVRLARPEEVLRATGFEVGTVPPFGHIHSLRTIIDVAVTQLSVAYGGGGDPDIELRVAVPDLLLYTRGSVADVAVGPPLEPACAQPAGAGLPLPWARGSEFVSLIAVVAQRRRIAKLLQFANLVPEQVPGLPPDGQAVYLRKLWRNPDTGAPTEVQLIMGKTLERNFGRDQAQALLDQVKVGCVVSVTGRVQPHRASSSANAPQQPKQQFQEQHQPPPQQQQQLLQQRSDVLDVVCHSVTVLHKSKDHLTKALRAAKRAGLGSASTALGLMELQRQAANGPVWSLDETGGLEPNDEASDEDTPWPASAAQSASSAQEREQPEGHYSALSSAQAMPAPAAAPSVAGASAADVWRMPLPMGAIRLVSSATDVEAMYREVLGEHGGVQSAAAATPAAAGPPDGAEHTPAEAAVVGLDCEWEPYERHQPKTPVSILQVANRQAVYIVDLLCLMGEGGSQASSNILKCPSACSPVGSAAASSRVSEGAAALSRFLSALMSSERVVKLGFQLAGDLDRLCDSYPGLPCFKHDCDTTDITDAAAPEDASGVTGVPSCSGVKVHTNGCRSDGGGDPPSPAGACRLCFDVVAVAKRLRPELSRPQQMSLSRLVELVLGKPLDKAQQRSAWARRPLSAEQLQYAATDAYCLVALYDALLGLDGCGIGGANSEPLERALEVLGKVAPALKSLPVPGRAHGHR